MNSLMSAKPVKNMYQRGLFPFWLKAWYIGLTVTIQLLLFISNTVTATVAELTHEPAASWQVSEAPAGVGRLGGADSALLCTVSQDPWG